MRKSCTARSTDSSAVISVSSCNILSDFEHFAQFRKAPHGIRFRHRRLRHDQHVSREGDRGREGGEARRVFRYARARRPRSSPPTNNCQPYTDLDAMLADPKVDIVTIATPSGAHMEPAVAAAKAGKHVIVEKPLEITLKKCDRIIEACEKAGVKLAAIFPSRFHDSSVKLKKAIDGGRFGRLTLGDAYVKWFRTQAVLRQRRVARHLGARWRRGADEPGDPQRRSAHVADGAGRRNSGQHGHARPRADRSRRRRRRDAAVRERCARRASKRRRPRILAI